MVLWSVLVGMCLGLCAWRMKALFAGKSRNCKRAGTEKYVWWITYVTLPLSSVCLGYKMKISPQNCPWKPSLVPGQVSEGAFFIVLSRLSPSIPDDSPISEEELVPVSLCACVINGS